jgi:Flp pilus assembly protein TadG
MTNVSLKSLAGEDVMSNCQIVRRRRPAERGQTIVLVAVALVSLLGMAALAIDVTTMYVARGEMQRAADAAALAGAKAFVDSGVTTDNSIARQTLAQAMITSPTGVINSILGENKVSGAAPTLVAATTDFTRLGNPQVTVTLQRTNLPTFFARIWGTKLVTVTATAVAEAYNASSSQNTTGNYVPVKPKCVKPLLIPNKDPVSTLQFVNPATGAAVATGVIGEAITLLQGCTNPGAASCAPANLPNNPPNAGRFIAAAIPAPSPDNLCPACQGASDFEQSIECCDFNNYSCGGAAPNANVDLTMSHGQLRNRTSNGVQCLINKPAQDTLDPTNLTTGSGPARITAGSGPQTGNLVTTSRSIASLPIIDTTAAIPPTGQVRVVGFLQVFLDDVAVVGGGPTNTQIQAHILNVVGCGNSPSGPVPVAGGGMSPIPVRLIH